MASVQSTLNVASQYLGTQDFRNYCEAFVEQAMYGHTKVYPSAISAWIAQKQKAVNGLQGIQPGDQVFFDADKSNGGYGHTGIYIGNGQFISATYNGVKKVPIANWVKSTGQKLLGYVPSGQAGRGIAQYAQENGQILSGQMQQASTLSDAQVQQMMTQYRAQQAAYNSQRVAAEHLDNASYFSQQAQSLQPQQQNSMITMPQNQSPQTPPNPQKPAQVPRPELNQASYPYAKYLTTPQSSSPTQPQQSQVPSVPGIADLASYKPTDYTKLQQ